MIFSEAFKAALAGQRIRRAWWHEKAFLETNDALHLVHAPHMHNWNGPYEVCLEDIEAEDWVAVSRDP